MGSSIFADESGDESARDRRRDEREPSVFRRPQDTEPASTDGTGEQRPHDDGRDVGRDDRDIDREGREDVDDATTMTVFSGDDVFEFAVDDER
ncbi:hypothetical protein [Halorubellus salinus]|uniref:hypothetical protein n=1 Tax=Halorubellus salinus TaxID=755309 RepID=UPI001D074C5B|nr:hypothetical protein [Halorubellus salinus]